MAAPRPCPVVPLPWTCGGILSGRRKRVNFTVAML
jgi:hypothetical protein